MGPARPAARIGKIKNGYLRKNPRFLRLWMFHGGTPASFWRLTGARRSAGKIQASPNHEFVSCLGVRAEWQWSFLSLNRRSQSHIHTQGQMLTGALPPCFGKATRSIEMIPILWTTIHLLLQPPILVKYVQTVFQTASQFHKGNGYQDWCLWRRVKFF